MRWQMPQRVAFESLHATGRSLLIMIAPQQPGVDIPPELRADNEVVLRLGADLDPPISDMVVEDLALTASLRFSGEWYRCVIPWNAVMLVAAEHEMAPSPDPTARPPSGPRPSSAPRVPGGPGGHLRLVP
jgi:hypothetical protein